MSRWGLISDVHGNRAALEEAIGLLRAARATRLAFLGDYLGRGDSEGCVRLIREQAAVALVGNRDLDWSSKVPQDVARWVQTLPRYALVEGLLLSHGDARLTPRLGTSQIGRGFRAAWEEMDRGGAEVWAFGHSHHARVWEKATRDEGAVLLDMTRLSMVPGRKYLLNVGTTGLPLPGKGGPSVALVDTVERTIEQINLAWKRHLSSPHPPGPPRQRPRKAVPVDTDSEDAPVERSSDGIPRKGAKSF